MSIKITNYDEYERACELNGFTPHSEEDIKSEVPYASGILREMPVGENVSVHIWNEGIKEYYEFKKVEEDVYEICFDMFME